MPRKKNNHIIPKCVVKEWVVKSNDRKGVYVYDYSKDKIFFSTSEGKRAFSFDIGSYIYVPEINNERKYNIEDWFAGVENTLAIVISRFKNRTEEALLSNLSDFIKLKIALFSIKHRTQYGLEKVTNFLNENREMKSLIEMQPNTRVDLAVLENMINAINEEVEEYNNIEMFVGTCQNGNLIMGDRPFLEEMVDGFNFLPLSPYFFVAFKKTESSSMFTYIDTNDKMVSLINRSVAQNSSNWIVSKNIHSLQELSKMRPDKSINKQPYYRKVRFLKEGYRIK